MFSNHSEVLVTKQQSSHIITSSKNISNKYLPATTLINCHFKISFPSLKKKNKFAIGKITLESPYLLSFLSLILD